MSKRLSPIVLAALLLGACGDDHPTPPAPPPGAPTAPKVTEAQPARAKPAPPPARTAKPSAEPVATKPASPAREKSADSVPQRPARVTGVVPPATRAEQQEDEDKPQPKPARKLAEAVRQANPPPSAAANEPLPPVKLDLRLPSEAVKQIEPGHKLARKASREESLLPPMFVERQASSPFQLNGRLITKEREDAIEGAELRFEFKQ